MKKAYVLMFLLGILLVLTGCIDEQPQSYLVLENKITFYGEVWIVNETGKTVTLTSTDAYANITGLSSNYTVGMNLVSGSYLNITQSGRYKIDYGISFSGGQNQLYGMTVGINGVAQKNRCYAHRTTTGTAIGNVGSSCIIYLAKGDQVTLVIADEANPTANAIIYMAGMAMHRVDS